MSDRHEVSSVTHEVHTRQILDRVAASTVVSQRSLSRELGIALGLTNLVVRRLVAKGWIRVVRLRSNQVRYVLTRAGFAQKARLSRDYFLHTVRFYTEARDRVQRRLAQVVTTPGGPPQTIVFYGAGEVAEVGWVCVQRTAVRLVAVVDDSKAGTDFFGTPVVPSTALSPDRCNGVPYDWLMVTAPVDGTALRARLHARNVPAKKILWL